MSILLEPDITEVCKVLPCASGPFTLCTAADFKNFPEMQWLIDQILPSEGLASIYGPSGVGKSFMCLDMAASIARGEPWFEFVTQESSVVYIGLEGQAGIRNRVSAWERFHSINFPRNVRFLFSQFTITKPDHVQILGKLVRERTGAKVIIIDTLNKSSPGSDENSSSDMGKIIAGATTLQQITGGLVLLVHHTGKDASRGLRGHSSLHAALDAIIETSKEGELTRWHLAKSKDGQDGISHSFKLSRVEIGISMSGNTLSSCVVEPVDVAPLPSSQNEPRGINQKKLLIEIRNLLMEHKVGTLMDENPARGLPYQHVLDQVMSVLDHVGDKHRLSRTKEALEALLKQGFLLVEGESICLPYAASTSSQ